MKMKNNSITVIGCGWLGLPFSEKMLEKGWKVKGTTTSSDKISVLKSMGVEPFLANFPSMEVISESIFNTNNLLINLPPGRRNPDVLQDYPKAIAQILSIARKSEQLCKIVFVSSTSVYGNSIDLIDESTNPSAETDSGKAILLAENLISQCGVPYVILRFGGLAGPGRHPGRFFAGRKELTIGKQSVNFLHLEDAIGVINYMFEHESVSTCFNVVSPMHPNKHDFYTHLTKSLGLEPPTFAENQDGWKREISVKKLLYETDYEFIHPDPMDYTF